MGPIFFNVFALKMYMPCYLFWDGLIGGECKSNKNIIFLYFGVASINAKNHAVTAAPVSMHVKSDVSRVSKDTLMMPYWHVETHYLEARSNMKFTEDTSKMQIDVDDIGKICVRLMKNTKTIKENERLVLFAPWTKPKPTDVDDPSAKKQKSS